jgi:hypothetical protein
MWTAIEDEDVPDGCTYIEVMYPDGTVSNMCSCDYWWYKSQNKKILPEFWRLADDT